MVEEIAKSWNISSKVNMELNLVLEELFTNIVFYAFPDRKDHLIEIVFELLSPGLLRIKLEDDGRHFDVMEAAKEVNINASIDERKIGGLGIHFVKQLMDEMNYVRRNNKNIVTLIKHL